MIEIRKTNEIFVQEVEGLVGREYVFLEEYDKARTPILVKHIKCGNEYKVSPNNFLRGTRCKKCFHKNLAEKQRKTHEEFVEEVNSLVGEEFTVTGRYVGTNVPIGIRHNVCGSENKMEPSNFLNGSRCDVCARRNLGKKRKLTNEEFLQRVAEQEDGEEYHFQEEYDLASVKMKVQHVPCGHEYEVTPNNFLRGKRCPVCSMPSGEKAVKDSLDKLKLNYEMEVSFPDLVREKPLRYDFGIKNEKGKIIGLIEFDGKQHFKPIAKFGGEEYFNYIKTSDRMKNEYSTNKGIPLLRIPYNKEDEVFEEVREFIDDLF